ncbi:hypothetical protein WNZ14_13570 [Hoeflea sp. AS60]|uniref:hypothetical protein n=1 Tax=Hoeflea sp. AS60 TaxID=3135780 RepID=UPI00317D5AF8
MANQWGRDSSFQPGGKRGSGALTVIAVVFALAIGAAGGYAASYFSQSDTSTKLDAAAAKTAEQEAALAAAENALSEARAAQSASAAQIEALKADVARMAGDLDAMTQRLAQSTSTAQTSAGDTAALDAMIRERDGLAVENQTLNESLKALEAERHALAETATAARERLETELARLQADVLPQLTAERDGLQRKTMMMLADQTNLKARIKAASDAAETDAGTIADLQARLVEAQQQLKASQEALATVEAAKSKPPEVQVPPAVTDSQQSEPANNSSSQTEASVSPRNRDAVATALRAAPGLETLSDANRRTLTEQLVAGECVTTALESVFDRIPILTLRDLIRDLNSGC